MSRRFFLISVFFLGIAGTFGKLPISKTGHGVLLTQGTGPSENYFNAADYGITPITPTQTNALVDLPADQGPAMLRLVDAVNKAGGNAVIIFPPGDYYWLGDPLENKGPRPSHDEVFRAHAAFKNLNSITIDTPGVRFFFMDVDLALFRFQHCNYVTLKNFSLDYFRSPSSVADIIARTNEYIDLRFWDEFPVTGNLPVRQLNLYDPKTRAVVHGETIGHRYGGMDATEKIAEQTLRVHFDDKQNNFPDSGVVAVKHRMYSADGIRFEYCDEILCENITIHSCSGMGFHADASKNITLRKCAVEPPEDSTRLLSSNADASHFSHVSGTVTLEDCRFISSGDDGNNTLAQYINISRIIDPATMIASRHDADYLYPFPFKAGQILEFVHQDELAPICRIKVAQIEFIENMREYRIKLAERLPKEINARDYRFCIVDYIPRYIARRVTCKNIRGRGLLCSGRDVLIEDCRFEQLSNGGILCAADTDSWGQAATLHDVIIRRNKFINNNHGYGPCFGEILIGSIVPGFKTGSPEGNRNILIEENQIKNTGQAWLALMGASHIQVRNNKIKNCMMSPLDRLSRWGYGSILLDRVRDITFFNNSLKWTRGGDDKFEIMHLIDTPANEIKVKK